MSVEIISTGLSLGRCDVIIEVLSVNEIDLWTRVMSPPPSLELGLSDRIAE